MGENGRNGTSNYKAFGRRTSSKVVFTIDEVIDNMGLGWPQIRIGFMAGLAWIADGMEIMVLSILGPTLEYDWHITPIEQALLTTLVFLGFCLGSPFFGFFADNYGRRTSLIMSTSWTLVYSVLSAASPNFIWMLILRMLLGLGIAGGMQINPYFSEFLPGVHRGKWTALSLLFWAVGSSLNVIVAMLLMPYGWRWWLLGSAIPAPIFLIVSMFLPESPRYKLACGEEKEARKILETIAEANGQTLPEGELKPIEVKAKGKIGDLFVPKYRRTSILLTFIWFGVGFAYYGIILSSTYLIQAGSTCNARISFQNNVGCDLMRHRLTQENYIELLWTSSADIPGVILTLIFSAILGRKAGSILQLIGFGILCLTLFFCIPKIPMIIILIAARALAISAFQLVIVYTTEVYPTEVRSLGSGCGNALARLGAMVTPYTAQVLLGYSLILGLSVYVVVAFLTAIAIFLLPVETKGREMAESLVK